MVRAVPCAARVADRQRPAISTLPKPLVVVKGKPILFHQIDYFLGRVGKIIISLGHRASEVEQAVRTKYGNTTILFSYETTPLGTAGGIKLAAQQATSDMVITINSDDITDISPELLNTITENTIAVAHPTLPFGLVEEQNGYAVFLEKPKLPSWVSVGWYVLRRQYILTTFPESGSIEYDVFPRLRVRVLRHEGAWFPLNNKKDLIAFESSL